MSENYDPVREFIEQEGLRLTCAVTNATSMDVMPEGVNKWRGTAYVAAREGIAYENIVAAGNYYNDLELIRGAGVGVAVRNAPGGGARAGRLCDRAHPPGGRGRGNRGEVHPVSGKKNAEKPFRRAYIEITNACNLNCAFCPGTRRAPRVLSPEEFALLARAVKPHTDYVCLHLMGEPLLHPALGRILEICGEEGLRANLTTNGTLLEDVKDILLSAPALRKLSVSLHSFEANGDGPPLEAYLSRVLPVVRLAWEAGIICELRLWNGGGARRLNGRVCRAIERELGVRWGIRRTGSATASSRRTCTL